MSANRLFLVCSAHPNIEDALCLGERATASSVYEMTATKRADKWLTTHGSCGVDHFQLAYHRPKGWDVSPPAQDTPAGAVRLAIAEQQLSDSALIASNPINEAYPVSGKILVNGSEH